MKMIIKNKKQELRKRKNKEDMNFIRRIDGFTIVETLFSLLLAALAILMISKIMVSAMDTDKKTHLRFNMLQKIENHKNQLISKSFDDPQLKAGVYKEKEDLYKMQWEVRDVSPTLKAIDFYISYKGYARRIFFYKSKYINSRYLLSTEVKRV